MTTSAPLTPQDVREATAMVCETVGQRWHGTQLEDACDECAGAIRAMELPPTGWQPIETAPMDGTRILVREDDFIAVAGWMTAIEDGTGAWIIWRQLGADAVAIRMLTPTHWHPLPAPPETTP